MTFEELRSKILQRGSELIAQGVSTEQLAYLMKGLEVLESIREKDAIADAIAQIGDIQAKYVEAKNLLNQVLETKALTQLGKPAIRLVGRTTWFYEGLPVTGNSSNASHLKYDELDWIKQNVVKPWAPTIELAPRDVFRLSFDHTYYNSNTAPDMAFSLFILKNTTEEEKQVSLSATLTANGSTGNRGAYIVVEGVAKVSYTSNGKTTFNLSGSSAITIPPKKSIVIYAHNSAYYQTNNNNVYYYHFYQKFNFTLPEGVEWDYEAYKELLS